MIRVVTASSMLERLRWAVRFRCGLDGMRGLSAPLMLATMLSVSKACVWKQCGFQAIAEARQVLEIRFMAEHTA